eukprot:TRINITY_DN6969_c0_g1_i6.p1 TRINITY_DN6969_c0_g1~~TRINITY_DN6969_c0_g1_i6.p1  ORF type:complete len:660 (+),score=111.97 TRINITY_DN6969_c0_g1_i6:49-2028(+)
MRTAQNQRSTVRTVVILLGGLFVLLQILLQWRLMHISTTTVETPPKETNHSSKKTETFKMVQTIPPHLSMDSLKPPYILAMATVVKNEARFIREWIEFHLIQGFQHFLIFDDDSEDSIDVILQPYIKAGIVEYNKLDTKFNRFNKNGNIRTQSWCYQQSLKYYNGKAQWVAFFDPDEFVYPVEQDSVIDFLKSYTSFGGLIVRGVIYGSSGITERLPPNQTVIESFTHRGNLMPFENQVTFCLVKSIVRPDYAIAGNTAHIFKYKPPYYAVDENMDKASATLVYWEKTPKLIRFHHYKVRTKRDWEEKKIKGVVQGNETAKWLKPGNSWQALDQNAFEDKSIMRYLPTLRKRLGLDSKPFPMQARQEIVILGMHRSGTSILTAILHDMGIYAGPTEDLVRCAGKKKAKSDKACLKSFNPKGYWENKLLVDLNDELLKSTKNHAWNMKNWNPYKAKTASVERFKQRVHSLMRAISAHPPYLLKDPRLCLTFPLWAPFLHDPVIIIAYRHPAGVARSIRHRDNWPLYQSAIFWEKYSLAALQSTINYPRLFVSFEEMAEDPIGTIQRLRRELSELGIPNLKELNRDSIMKLFDVTMDHHNSTSFNDNAITKSQQLLYDKMRSGDAAKVKDWSSELKTAFGTKEGDWPPGKSSSDNNLFIGI